MTLHLFRSATLLAFMLVCSTLSAQLPPVALALPSYEQTNTGDILDFPITVENFQGIIGMAFMIRWNPQVLEFQALDLSTNPMGLVDTLHFNINQTNEGQFRCVWSGSPKTVANGAALYQLRMKVIGTNGSSTAVDFTQSTTFPTIFFEILRNPGPQFFNLNNTALTQGEVTVGIVSTQEADNNAIPMLVAPNPIEEAANLTFVADRTSPVLLTIVSPLGQVASQRWLTAAIGANQIRLSSEMFSGSGLYYISLQHAFGKSVCPIWVN
jgi:Cohesin domain